MKLIIYKVNCEKYHQFVNDKYPSLPATCYVLCYAMLGLELYVLLKPQITSRPLAQNPPQQAQATVRIQDQAFY